MARTAKGKKALTAASKKRPAAAMRRPAAAGAAAPVAKKPAAGAASAGGGPTVVKAKKGWQVHVFARGGNTDHGASYKMWVEPSGKRHRTYTSAAAAGFVA